MQTDLTIKITLSVIAVGLLLNGLQPILSPTLADASLANDIHLLSDIKLLVQSIANGTCSNLKICE